MYINVNVMNFENVTNIKSVNENENAACVYCNSLYSCLKSNEIQC